MDVREYTTVFEPIGRRALLQPGRRALTLIGDDGSHDHLTDADLDLEARAYARGLREAGIGAGDVVVLALGSLRPLIGAFLGVLYRGAVPSVSSFSTDRFDAALRRRRISDLLGKSDAAAIVSSAEQVSALEEMAAEPRCRVLAVEGLRATDAEAAEETPVRSRPEDIAFLQYSSGTAGPQKGVANSHRAVLRYIEAKRREWEIPHQVLVHWLPLYHDLGMVSGLLCPLVLGLHGVLMSPQHWVRDPKILLQAIHTYRGTLCYMPNFAMNHCARGVRDRDLEGIDLGNWVELVSGGEPVRPESLAMFAERFAPYGFRASALRAGYGMAELVEGVSVSPHGSPPHVDWIDRAAIQERNRAVPVDAERPGRIAVVGLGRPCMGAEMRIAGANGEILPERGVGEIEIRSDFMFEGYYREPDLTARAFHDGWFRSGDVGYLLDGQIYVTGRKTDLIIVGGRNVHPEDLERIADEIPGLAPGRSVAFGVPDPALGSERIVMISETREEYDADQKLALERQLRRRVAEEIGVTLGDVRLVARGWVTKTSSGKTARGLNRERFLSELSTPEPKA